MDLQLEGRRALVTGSSDGIGVGIARLLAAEGCRLVVHGRNRERAEKVAAAIGAAGVAIGDLTSDEGAAAVHAQASDALGGTIEILVNNAGGASDTGSGMRAPIDVAVEDWLATYQINTLSAVRMILRCVPGMVAAKWGRVIQISSAVAVQPNNLGPDYSGSKAALNNLTVSLAGSLKNVGVTVNTISPGLVTTRNLIEWARGLYASQGAAGLTDEEVVTRMATEMVQLPVGRLGIPDDIGFVACMLASPRSGYITGANYRVDGGQSHSIN
jgi:NAD(P)-dependent dehydrogenase (short-subunit alcohol dehydrogenase family)